MKESMLKDVRIEAGLGDPPCEYVNNDPEAANFMIKHGLQFDSKKPHQFIQEIKNIVETQQHNEDRAVFGKGPYKVRKEFEHLKIDDMTWGRLTHEQRMRKLSAFLSRGMDEKEEFNPRRASKRYRNVIQNLPKRYRGREWDHQHPYCYTRVDV